MKKSILLLLGVCFFLSGQTNLFAQKAKFKTKLTSVQKTRLPENFIDPEKRTYDLYAQGSYASQIDPHQKSIFGWKKNTENPNVKGVVSIFGFSVGSPSLGSEKKQKKDKDGKVTDSWTEYYYSNSAEGKGTLYIYGDTNPFKYKSSDAKEKKTSKYEEKKAAAAKEKEKALADNPFLSSDDVAEAAESDIGTDEGLDGEALPLVNRISVNQSKDVKTKNFRSSSAAYADYKKNHRDKLYNFKSSYPNSAYRSAISQLNRSYGYSPVKENFYMRMMKTEKHPEFKTWNDASVAATTLFKTVRYNKAINETSTKFDPIIKYFAGMVETTNDDKKAKKLNKAAFKNLTNIMFYLDRHDDLITIAKSNLESKNLDRVAKRILDDSKKLKAKLLFHNMTSCHIENGAEVNEDDIEENKAEEEVGEN